MGGNSSGLIKVMHGESAQMMNTAVGIPISSRERVRLQKLAVVVDMVKKFHTSCGK